MSQFDTIKAVLKADFARLGINRVVYFHCDHWEPWRPVAGSDAIGPVNRDEVARFVDESLKLDYASRLTLFYKSPVNFIYDHSRVATPGIKAHPDDVVRFVRRSAAHAAITREALRYVVERSEMDVQVHIHHENVTHNTAHTNADVMAALSSPVARRHEEARLSLLIQEALAHIGEDIGRPLARWFFVHGHWGLNASDPAVCHVTREIAILMEHGCLGDFTVPSGRPVVNPRLEVPYFVTPVDAAKGYDRQEGGPELAYGNRTAPERGKFLIWSSVVKQRGASLDYYAPWLQTRLQDPEQVARDLINQSYAVDGTLFIKTHAHSMHPNYNLTSQAAVFPHAHPPIRDVFGVLFDAAAAAGCRVDFRTVSEVYDAFIGADYTPPGGHALTIAGDAPVIAGTVPADRSLCLKHGVVALAQNPLTERTTGLPLGAERLPRLRPARHS